MHSPAEAAPVGLYQQDGLHAFVHDLTTSPVLPADYDQCDVIYVEPPWGQPAITEFMRRRGEVPDGGEWKRFVRPLKRAIEQGRYVVIVASAYWKREALFTRPIWFDGPGAKGQGIRATLAVFNGPELGAPTSTGLITELAATHSCVGDPCCGYGNTGRLFLKAGKTAILSDADPACIGVIAEEANGWGWGLTS